jgi:hypothetical protein
VLTGPFLGNPVTDRLQPRNAAEQGDPEHPHGLAEEYGLPSEDDPREDEVIRGVAASATAAIGRPLKGRSRKGRPFCLVLPVNRAGHQIA